MATGTQDPNATNVRQSWINLITLLVALGVITVLVLIPVLLVAGGSPILGPWWVGGAALVGAALGVWTLTISAHHRWQGALAILAIVLGLMTAASTAGIIFQFDPVVAGLVASVVVVLGTVSLVLLVHDWTRIGVILVALFFAGFAIFSIAGALWAFILQIGTIVLTWLFDPNRVDQSKVVACYGPDGRGCAPVHAIVYSLLFFFIILTGFAYTTLLERKFIAWFQQRSGPNRVGPMGLLQPAADGVKLIFKEDIRPSGADIWVYRLAPMIKAVPPLIVLAVIPLGPNLLIPWFDGYWYKVPLGLADPNVGVLWLLAILSIGTYGVVLAGWSSNNKYAMIGGLRATAQMLSYELSLGLTMAVPILIVGSMSLGDIIRSQTYIYQWFVFQNPLAAAILFIALLAEVNRAPFDLPEAEQELTQGYMTEYSGMKFALFMMAEYLGMIAISIIVCSLFLGGYNDGFGIVQDVPILGPVVLIGKVVLFLIFMIWIRATLPRIRYDRLMALGWKVMLPLAIVAVMWSAVAVMVGDAFSSPIAYGIAAGVFFVVVVVGGLILLQRSGQLEAPATEIEDDPVITGEQKDVGYYILQVVGGLIAVPFALWDFTLGALDNLAKLAPPDEPQEKKESGGD
ncbi:MAG TPA: NADH-quinone oxidoreductase subunit NuoH [Phototrophicaceae bacterium]|nr:NADH-quinone oxidoreductase subunit NuoH [Phototrophicaceae bacterium]